MKKALLILSFLSSLATLAQLPLNGIGNAYVGGNQVDSIMLGAIKVYPPSDTSFIGTYGAPALAYSLRDLTNNGDTIIRVRRSSDNSELAFSAPEITNGTLTTWTGANDGFIVTWYDQSGNGKHATQSIVGGQPTIVSSGSLVTDNGKPSVYFDGAGDRLEFTSTDLTTTQSIFIVSNSSTTDPLRGILRFNTNTYFRIVDLQGDVDFSYGFPQLNFNFVANANQKLITAISVSGTKNVWQDSGASADNPIIDASGSTTVNRISTTGIGSYSGTLQEVIVYTSDKTSQRVDIETNINQHYVIY